MTKKQRSSDHEVQDEAEQPKEEQIHKNQEEETEKFKNLYLRALADYKNLEHRMNQERQRMRISIKKEMIYTLLPVLDNIDQAEVFNQDPGLKMVGTSFRKALQEMGVTDIDLIGTEYNPEYAEVVQVVEGEADNIVVAVVQKAYQLDGQVIRPGKVTVSTSK